MTPMLNYSPTAIFECKCCGDEIEVDYSKLNSSNEKVKCLPLTTKPKPTPGSD